MGWMAKNRLSKNSVMLIGTKLARNGDKKGLDNLKCYEMERNAAKEIEKKEDELHKGGGGGGKERTKHPKNKN